jgi:hypothetical protein
MSYSSILSEDELLDRQMTAPASFRKEKRAVSSTSKIISTALVMVSIMLLVTLVYNRSGSIVSIISRSQESSILLQTSKDAGTSLVIPATIADVSPTELSEEEVINAEKRIREDLTEEDYEEVKQRSHPTQEIDLLGSQPDTYLCSLDSPSRNEGIICQHQATSFFVQGSPEGNWPRGFSWVLMSNVGDSTSDPLIVHSDSGLFKQGKNLKCDQFVRTLCLQGNYILYASMQDDVVVDPEASLGGKDSLPFVDVCNHAAKITPGQTLKFNVNPDSCSNLRFDKHPNYNGLNLAQHQAVQDARSKNWEQLNADGAAPVELDKATRVKLSDRTLERKKGELKRLEEKISVQKDQISLDSAQTAYDQHKLLRFSADVEAEQQLVELFKKKVEKSKTRIDEDQDKMQKDEMVLDQLKTRKNKVAQSLTNPYDANDNTYGNSGDDSSGDDNSRNDDGRKSRGSDNNSASNVDNASNDDKNASNDPGSKSADGETESGSGKDDHSNASSGDVNDDNNNRDHIMSSNSTDTSSRSDSSSGNSSANSTVAASKCTHTTFTFLCKLEGKAGPSATSTNLRAELPVQGQQQQQPAAKSALSFLGFQVLPDLTHF